VTEPVLIYCDPTTDRAWFEWLQAKDDKQLAAYWEYIRNWTPARDHPSGDPDAMQMKYELTAQEMDRRKLSDDGTPQHDYEPGDKAHNMAGDPDCRVCGETRRTCEGP
jgi:hypothetical protein